MQSRRLGLHTMSHHHPLRPSRLNALHLRRRQSSLHLRHPHYHSVTAHRVARFRRQSQRQQHRRPLLQRPTCPQRRLCTQCMRRTSHQRRLPSVSLLIPQLRCRSLESEHLRQCPRHQHHRHHSLLHCTYRCHRQCLHRPPHRPPSDRSNLKRDTTSLLPMSSDQIDPRRR